MPLTSLKHIRLKKRFNNTSCSTPLQFYTLLGGKEGAEIRGARWTLICEVVCYYFFNNSRYEVEISIICPYMYIWRAATLLRSLTRHLRRRSFSGHHSPSARLALGSRKSGNPKMACPGRWNEGPAVQSQHPSCWCPLGTPPLVASFKGITWSSPSCPAYRTGKPFLSEANRSRARFAGTAKGGSWPGPRCAAQKGW